MPKNEMICYTKNVEDREDLKKTVPCQRQKPLGTAEIIILSRPDNIAPTKKSQFAASSAFCTCSQRRIITRYLISADFKEWELSKAIEPI